MHRHAEVAAEELEVPEPDDVNLPQATEHWWSEISPCDLQQQLAAICRQE